MTAFVATVVVGVGTYVSRSIFIVALAKKRIPEAVLVTLQFVAPAVLAALVVTLLTNDDGMVSIGVPEIAAFVAGGATVYKTRSHILTLVVGMAIYWIVRAVA